MPEINLKPAFIFYQNTYIPSFPDKNSSNIWVITRIKKAILESTGLEFSDYNIKSRNRSICLIRQIFYYLARYNTTLSLKEIGEQFSYNYFDKKTKSVKQRNYDHSTVIHGIATINSILDSYDCSEKIQVNEIIKNFKKGSKL